MRAPNKSDLTCQQVRDLLEYDPDTGAFRWRLATRTGPKKADGLAGTIARGRRQITICGRPYFGYRLAWLYMTGEWPQNEIDHIDGDASNDRWTNLRDVPHAFNMQNRRRAHSQSKSGMLGVTKSRSGNRFHSQIELDGRTLHLGSFMTGDEAQAAYVAVKRAVHPGCTL